MEIVKKYKLLIVIPLIVFVTGVAFLIHLYQRDLSALSSFTSAYEKFDSAAILAANSSSTPTTNDLEKKATTAYLELKAQADIRISSLIKNDKELMTTRAQIVDLASKELTSLMGYQTDLNSKNAEGVANLGKKVRDFDNQRIAAYSHFLQLTE